MSDSKTEHRDAWRRQVYRLREAITETLVEIPQRYPSARVLYASRQHRQLHNLIFEYRSLAQPYQHHLNDAKSGEELWTEQIAQPAVPISGEVVRLDDENASILATASEEELLSLALEHIEYRQVPVSLGTVDELFEDETLRITVEGWTPNAGQRTRTISEPLYAPVSVCRAVRNQLDLSYEHLGWLPGVDIDEGDAGFEYEDILETGPPTDVETALQEAD